MELKYDVFISYSRADQKVAEGICGYLENSGLRCFIDYRDIPRGAVWARVLPDAIRRSGMMVAVFSPNYNKSMQVERELSIADKAGIPVLPFRLSDAPFEGLKSYYFESINWIDAFPNPEMVFGTLLSDIQAIKEATENWQLGRNPAAGAVTMNLESIDGDIVLANDIVDPKYEDDYSDGVDSIRHLEYADAFSYLIEPALANYRHSQLYMSWIADRNFIALIPRNAWPYLRAKAEDGNPFAQYLMSRYHSVIEVDNSQAFEYAARSARQGNLLGRYALAKLYDLGEGVEQDDRMGIDKIKELERLDLGPAMRELARHYMYGFSYKKNPRRGIRILERGVDLGISECILELGLQKIYGDFIPADLEGGRALVQQAVDDGMMEALDQLARSYLFDYTGSGFLKDPAAQRKFRDITNRGVKLNNPMSMSTLAFVHRRCASEAGMKTDINTAMRWYQRATELCNRDAALDLGYIYYYGEDSIETDEPLAWKWFRTAASLQLSGAEYYLGIMCLDGYAQDGEGKTDCLGHFENSIFLGGWGAGESSRLCYSIFVPADFENGFPGHPQRRNDVEGFAKDEEKALYYLRKGVNYENAECTYLLGCALTDTSRPYANEIEGIGLLEKTLSMPVPCYYAALRLHRLYTDGIGVGTDPDKAAEYLAIARENLAEEDVNAYLESLKAAPAAKTFEKPAEKPAQPAEQAPVSPQDAEEGRKYYDRALPFCREGASHWDLMRALGYLDASTRFGYAPAEEMKKTVKNAMRVIYDRMMTQTRPDFRLLGQMMFAPLLKDPIAEDCRTKAFGMSVAERVKSRRNNLNDSLAACGIDALPEPTADLVADAAAFSKVWWQIIKKRPSLTEDGVSPLGFDEYLTYVENMNDTDSITTKMLMCYIEYMIELEELIITAKKLQNT